MIGVAAALFLYFTYNSLTSLPPYKEKPETLDKATAAAAAKLVARLTKKAAEVAKFPAYGDMIDQFKTPVDPHAYPMKDPLYWKQYSPLRLRPTPEVLAVEHLRTVPGRGAIAKDNGATAGKRWVVVTGLVPYKKQLKEYRSKFESAASFDPGEDVPKYAGFFVQKAEVVPGATRSPSGRSPPSGSRTRMPRSRCGAARRREILPIRASSFRNLFRLCPCWLTRPGATTQSPRRQFPLSNTRPQGRRALVECSAPSPAVSRALVAVQILRPGPRRLWGPASALLQAETILSLASPPSPTILTPSSMNRRCPSTSCFATSTSTSSRTSSINIGSSWCSPIRTAVWTATSSKTLIRRAPRCSVLSRTNRMPSPPNGRVHASRTGCRAKCACWAGRSSPPRD